MSYADLLKDRRWQKKRLEVLEAAGWVCEQCGSDEDSEQMHVHHLRYIHGRMPWDYPNDELQALCKPCHDEDTEWCRRLDELVRRVKLGGALDVQEAVGYLSALVANGWRAVAENETTIQVLGCCDADGIGKYILGPTQADTFAISHAGKSGRLDAYKLRLEFIRSKRAHKSVT